MVGLGALLLGKPNAKCEEHEATKVFGMAVERYMPGMIQEIETGRVVVNQVNEVMGGDVMVLSFLPQVFLQI